MRRSMLRILTVALAGATLLGGTRAAAAQERTQADIGTGTLPVTDAWRSMKVLRVCGDPDNMPFSDSTRQGFENKLATIIASALGDSVSYVWWPHRRGFIRNTLNSFSCDVIMGVPAKLDMVLTTKPYFRSTYYVVSRADRHIDVSTLNDPAIRTLRIGVNLIGEDYTNTPPTEALAARGISRNLKGYSSFYDPENHPRDIIEGVTRGDVDIALVWGPLAGYWASKSSVPLKLVPLPDSDSTGLPFAYDVAIGVRHTDRELRDRLNEILSEKHAAIEQLLQDYHVPQISPAH